MVNEKILNYFENNVGVRFVPEAEVNPGILNVGFGDVGYLRCKGIVGRVYRVGGCVRLCRARGGCLNYIFL